MKVCELEMNYPAREMLSVVAFAVRYITKRFIGEYDSNKGKNPHLSQFL